MLVVLILILLISASGKCKQMFLIIPFQYLCLHIMHAQGRFRIHEEKVKWWWCQQES